MSGRRRVWLGAVVAGAGVASVRGGHAHRLYTVVVFIVLASLDNVAIGLVPPLFSPIAESLDVAEAAIERRDRGHLPGERGRGRGWAYVGRPEATASTLLMIGTLIWAAGTFATPFASDYAWFLVAQVIGAVGLGAVASVGFSVVSDLISPRRRGLVMSFWGLSQGVGTLVGTLLAGLLGSADWRRPFYVLTVRRLGATVAYLFTYNIRRGESEPQLAAVFAAGEDYDYRISRARPAPRSCAGAPTCG